MDPIQPLQKNDFMIIKLILTDDAGVPIKKPFMLKDGKNTFRCRALYSDGTEDFFNPYWTCPIFYQNGEYDVWSVFGGQRRESVTINASPNHEKYSELACWVFPPKRQTPTGNAEIPHDSTGFDYTSIL